VFIYQQRGLKALRNAKWRRGVLERKIQKLNLQKHQTLLQQAHMVLSERRLRADQTLSTDSSDEEAIQNEEFEVESVNTPAVQTETCDSSRDESEILAKEDVVLNLNETLRSWVNHNKISQTATQQLLKILIPHHPQLPRHQRTLLRTATDISLDKIAGGDYSYISLHRVLPIVLKKAGLTMQHLQDCNNQLKLQFNVDGVPVFNSVNYSIWPILGSLMSPIKSHVFTVAIFGGKSKPNDFNAYMKPLVDELQQIAADGGFLVEDLCIRVQVLVENFCCDAPAKADLRLVKQFNARHGCERCNVTGTYMQHRMVLEIGDQETRLRQDDDFDTPLPDGKGDRVNDEYRKQESVLYSDLRLRMISQFPYDYMHLVCLNVVRNMAGDLNRAKSPVYIPGSFAKICNHLATCVDYIPAEFQRKCRSISDAKRWKATEARQFLLYTGVVVLRHPGVPCELYEHFLQLSVAIRCLCSPSLIAKPGFIALARQLLEIFASGYGELYGREQVTYRIHSLIHLADDVERYGVLDNFSCFKFENYLGSLKELVHKRRMTHIVQQICRRLSERDYILYDDSMINRECHDSYVPAGAHMSGPILPEMGSVNQFEIVRCNQYLFGRTKGNQCLMANNAIYFIENIVVTNKDKLWLLCRKFLREDDLFTLPRKTDGIPKQNILHSGRLGIWKVADLSNRLIKLQLNKNLTVCKCVLLPTNDTEDKFVALTMLHDR